MVKRTQLIIFLVLNMFNAFGQTPEIIDSAEVMQLLLPPSFDIREECIRGEAEPVLRTSVFQQPILSDKQTV